MSLSTSTLAASIKTEIEAQFGPADDVAQLTKFADAIAKAVVEHINNEAQVIIPLGVPGAYGAPGTFGVL